MLELVDEVDSKSIGLIPRAGSIPATGTKIASMRCASEQFLLPDRLRQERLRVARQNGICRRNLVAIIQMRVNVGGCPNVAVSQPFLNVFPGNSVGI